MTHDPTAEDAETYMFENETAVYELDANSDEGRKFRNLSTGPDKIEFLKKNGRRTMKQTGELQGRIMIHRSGAWRHYNDGQFEYGFQADDDFDGGFTPLNARFHELETLEEKREFMVKNATRIRRWPDRVDRVPNLV